MTSVWSRRWSLSIGGLRIGLPVRHWLLLLVAVALLASVWVVFASPVLGVRRVEVRGVTTLTAAEVRSAAAVTSGAPLARLNTAAVADRIRSLPRVARAEVFRAWPDTVRVEVTERVAVAVVAAADGFGLVDIAGVVFGSTADPAGLPLVELAVVKPHDPTTVAAVRVAHDLPADLRPVVASVSATSPEKVSLLLTDGRTVFWGPAQDNARKSRVVSILLDRPGSHMDVSAPGVATVR